MMAVAYASFAMFAMLIEAAFGWGDGQVRRRAVNILLGSCGFAIAYATVAVSGANSRAVRRERR